MRLSLTLLTVVAGAVMAAPPAHASTDDVTSGGGAHAATIGQLVQKIRGEQVQVTKPFIAGEHYYEKAGIYGSTIKQNFHGSFQLAEARRTLGCFDNNMFATAWVTSALLEAYIYSGAPKPPSSQLELSIAAMKDHHNMNRPYNNSLMTFWEQMYDKNVSYYQSSPYNIKHVLELGAKMPLEQIDAVLHDLGLGKFGDDIKHIIDDRYGYLQAFHIPPDFDDTFVNVGLGSLLHRGATDFPLAHQAWAAQNTNLTSAFDALKKYAYRPFSDDRNVNSLDPRTYVYLRKFIDQAALEGKNVSLVPTWIQNLEELETEYAKGVIMPFEINNVDTTVAANTVYGVTAALLQGLVPASILDDPEMEAIYHNTSMLLAYEINTNMTNRPDVALLYYPSQIEYDWFVARTFAIMHEWKLQGRELPHVVMEDVYQTLKAACEGEMTRYILYQAQYDNQGRIYYDDFLGDGDLDLLNRTMKRGEDRIFTTAMAANALMYTWTDLNATTRTSVWRAGTPTVVRKTVQAIVAWLDAHLFGPDFDPWNAFFSGSYKGPTTWQDYPHNVYEFLNGTQVPAGHHWRHGDVTVRCTRGAINESYYEAELKRLKSPTVFHGYNSWDGFFPYWSSSGYTYAINLLVFSRYDSIVG